MPWDDKSAAVPKGVKNLAHWLCNLPKKTAAILLVELPCGHPPPPFWCALAVTAALSHPPVLLSPRSFPPFLLDTTIPADEHRHCCHRCHRFHIAFTSL